MAEVVARRPKPYAYLMGDSSDHKKAEGTKRCVIKQKLMFENYEDCLFNKKTVYRSQKRFRNYYHDVCTEEVNKIALISNMIKDYNYLIGLQHIHMEQVK